MADYVQRGGRKRLVRTPVTVLSVVSPSYIPGSHLYEYNPPLTTPRPARVAYPRFRRCGASSEGACADLPHLRFYHCAFPLFQSSLTFPV